METFSALLAFCAGNSPVTGEVPAQRPVTRSFDVFFDLRPNEWLSKQWRRWWFETSTRSLGRHCNVTMKPCIIMVDDNHARLHQVCGIVSKQRHVSRIHVDAATFVIPNTIFTHVDIPHTQFGSKTRWRPLGRWHFQIHVLELKLFYFRNFHELFSQWPGTEQ